jgi:hypothetical protein
MKKETIKGFKAFKKDFKCMDFQYEVGKSYTKDEDIILCKSGFYFCEMPLDVLSYYGDLNNQKYAEIEAKDIVKKDGDKSVTNNITIKNEITIKDLFNQHFNIVFGKNFTNLIDKITKNPKTTNTSGNNAHANTSGDEAHANTSGYKAHANTSGYKAHANTSGNNAHANTSGNNAHANTSGNNAHANTSGDEAISCTLGYQSKSKASNGWIVLVDWRQDKNYKYFIKEIYRAKVGKHKVKGQLIKPDTWYWMENGNLKSEK